MSLGRLQQACGVGGLRKDCGGCGGGCAEDLCMAARVGEETFEDSVFPVWRKGLGGWACPYLPGYTIICLT